MTSTNVTTASPVQREIRRQALNRPGQRAGCTSMAGRSPTRIAPEAARAALAAQMAAYDVLRASYRSDASGVLGFSCDTGGPVEMRTADWTQLDARQVAASKAALLAERDALDWDACGAMLACAALADGGSWIMLALPAMNADLATVSRLLRCVAGAADEPAGEAIQYADVADWLNDFQISDAVAEARAAWDQRATERAFGDEFGLRAPRSHPDGKVACMSIALPASVHGDAAAAGTSVASFVCAALRMSMAAYGERALLARSVDMRAGALHGVPGPITQHIAFDPAPAGSLAQRAAAEEHSLAALRDYVECFARSTAGSFAFLFSSVEAADDALAIEHAQCRAEAARMHFILVQQGARASLHIAHDTGFIGAAQVGQLADELQRVLAGQALLAGSVLHGAAVSDAAGRANVVAWFDQAAASGQLTQDELSVPFTEIQARANAVANYLLAAGLQKGAIVALHLPSSIQFVVAMLGTLKAGGAYLPLDVKLPQARVDAMLAECRPAFVIQDGARTPGALDIAAIETEARDSSAPPVTLADTDPAYLLYTSGSTGTAKGIAISHAALVNHMAWMLAEFDFQPHDVFLQRTSVSFDASIWEFWAPLLAGATLVIAPPDVNYQPALMAATLARHGVSVLQLVPSLLSVLLEHGAIVAAGSVRQLFLGGEALPTRVAREASERMGCAVVNLYGPSECCIQVTFERFDPALACDQVPIGAPINNVACLVVRADGQLAAPGQEGELLMSGRCLFQGYQARADLTAQAMVEHHGVACYRTGDWVRVLPDHRLYFLERKDEQIKLNGFRIELEEISALVETGGLAAHAVCVVDQASGQLTLCVVAPSADQGAILASLRARLPDYMVPSSVLVVPELPRLTSGKIDRKALVMRARDAAAVGYVAPVSATEIALAAIWTELLKPASPIGIATGFFTVGGDSLLAMRLTSRICEQFGVDLKMRSVFDHDTIGALAAHIGSLGQAAAAIAPRSDRSAPAPLSFAQQRMWFVDQLEQSAGAYNVPRAFRVHGPLDVAAVKASLGALIERHPALRTRIVMHGAEPMQQVGQAGALPLTFTDLSRMTEAARATAVNAALQAELAYRFDLGADLMVRAHVLALAAEEHVLIFNMHHIVSDGWTQGIFMREFGQLYAGACAGAMPALAPIALDYADFAIWQRALLQSDAAADKLTYWKTQLAGLPELHSLPLDYPRRAGHSGGATLGTVVGGALQAAIAGLCRQHGVTQFMFLQSALAVLLSRYSNETDIVIGCPVSGRAGRELEPLMGCFVNNLVIRNDLSADPAFAQFLQRGKQLCLEAQANQDIPFELLVEELNPERSLNYNPLFQVMLVAENAEAGAPALERLRFEPMSVGAHAAKFDLLLGARAVDEGLLLSWTYNSGLFAAASIERMSANFIQLLEAIVADPATRLSALPMLSAAERSLLASWNRSATDWSEDATLHGLFEAQAAATPHARAVSDAAGTLSYAALNERANGLAHHLGPQQAGTVIGLCMERSASMVAAMLAILKTGAAYLPLDPSHPPARLAYMIAHAGVRTVLADQASMAALPAGVDTVCADSPAPAADGGVNPGNPPSSAVAGSVACAIYTSGSTGEPKAVLLPHRSVVNRLQWMRTAYPTAPDEVFCQKTSLNFVDHVAEVFQPLTQGTPLVVIGADAAREAQLLAGAIGQHGISRVTLVPSMLQALLEQDGPDTLGALGALRLIISSGEALSGQLAARVKACLPQARLLNIYGATEVAADVTCEEYRGGDIDSVAMGCPIANSRAYVLDARGGLLPVGAVGELHIAGAALALGYLGQPALSAARFVADPFAAHDGALMYRTGDMVRWLADGRLAYVGRKDHQMKLRGMRIESGEIEAQLCRLDGVAAAVVMPAMLPGQDQPLLAAWLVSGTGLDLAGCRKALRAVLPESMVPSVLMAISALPLTRTGKIDRKALPAPSAADLHNASYVAPRNATEASLCRLWEGVLKRERVGIEDNFFESGGHSLLATRLISRIRQELEVALPLRALFEHPTIAGLCAALPAFARGAAAGIPRADRSAPLALSFAQQRLWFIDQLEGASAQYNLPMQFELKGELDVAAFGAALHGLVERHEVLRSALVEIEGQPRQVIGEPYAPALGMHDLRAMTQARQVQEVARITGADAATGFDLGAGQLLRARLLRLEEQRYRVFLNLPHIAADGWSLGILLRELNALYNAFCQGLPSPLAPLAIQYADHAQWQRGWLQGATLDRQLGYWRTQLDGLPAMHSLPLDKPRPARQRFKGKTHAQTLDPALLGAVHALCQQQKVTLFMFLQSAFAVLLQRYSNETDIVIGAPVAGREQRETEPLMGLFVNSLVLRSNGAGNPAFSTLLQQNSRMILSAFEHQAVPFEMLVEQLQPERSLSHSPLFQVTLTLQNNEQQQLDFHGLSLERNVNSHNSIKCDLELTVTEADGQLYMDWDYNVDLFERASIERMAANFEVLVRAIVAQPGCPIGNLPLLSGAEQSRLLDVWNDSGAALAQDSVHALFEAQAAATPQQLALTHGARSFSYAELNERANRLAHYLAARGAADGAIVGLCLGRSASMVVAMLAIMKAGAAYLPLDPDFPPGRLATLAQDARVALIVSESLHLAVLPPGHLAVCLDDAAVIDALADSPAHNRPAPVSSDAAACVIYTSGSTGEPKGVAMPHRAIVNRMAWMARTFPLAANEVFCQKTPLNFVDHVAEVFQPLTQGTPLIVIDKESVRDVDLLVAALRMHRISRITLVPSLLALLVEHEEVATLGALRCVISSGEPLSGALAARMRARLPTVQLINLYGSTEVGADVSYSVPHGGAPLEVMQYFPDTVELAFNGLGAHAGAPVPLALSRDVVQADVQLASLLADFSSTATPESSLPYERYVAYLNEKVMPHVVNVSSRKFIGHMTSQLPSFMAEFARLITVMNQNMVKIETSKSLTLAERQALAMVHRQFFDQPEALYSAHAQAPHSNFGLITSGGTTANISAMTCARNRGLRALGFTQAEVAAKGASQVLMQAGMGPGVIIGSRLAHYSIRKAANLLGIGEENILLIDQDGQQRLSMAHLRATIERCRADNRFIICVIGMGGATETGTIDPLPEMAAISAEFGLHFHVDAAWGGAFRFSARHRSKLKGIECADSVTFCAHKQLYLPQGISMLLFKNPQDTGVSPIHTAYQAQRGSFDMGQHTLEGSRPANALLLHAALHLLSRQGYGWLVDQSMDQARHFAGLVEASGAFELVGQPEINIVNYRYIPAALRGKKYSRFSDVENEAISDAVESIQQEQFLRAKTFVSKTRVLHSGTGAAPVTVFRVVLSNPLITQADLRDVLLDQIAIAADTVEQGQAGASAALAAQAIAGYAAARDSLAVALGKPIDNMRIYVLDSQLQLLPQGARGELYVAGPGLALGYLNRPQLTAERFIDHPLAAGGKLFRTGDFGRWLPDGTLQFCGRTDAQYKLRGARVELGEVEAALKCIAGVSEAVLAAPALENGERRLVAYVALEADAASHCEGWLATLLGGDAKVRAVGLRAELRRVLPDFMIPEQFVFVEHFATTVSGKIDRSRLPAPAEERSGELAVPRSELERMLCAIWRQILKRDAIGVKCNFFDLGGHSLLAMTMMNHIRQRLGVRLPLVTLFEYPDIEGLASVIEALSAVAGDAETAGALDDQVDMLL